MSAVQVRDAFAAQHGQALASRLSDVVVCRPMSFDAVRDLAAAQVRHAGGAASAVSAQCTLCNAAARAPFARAHVPRLRVGGFRAARCEVR